MKKKTFKVDTSELSVLNSNSEFNKLNEGDKVIIRDEINGLDTLTEALKMYPNANVIVLSNKVENPQDKKLLNSMKRTMEKYKEMFINLKKNN